MKAFARFWLKTAPWLALFCLGVLYAWDHLLAFPWVWREVNRLSCPSGRCELVTYVGSRGAMSSFAYVCFLLKPGTSADPNAVDWYEPVLASTHLAPTARWAGDDRLIIKPEGGYVTHHRPWAREFKVYVEIADAQAPVE